MKDKVYFFGKKIDWILNHISVFFNVLSTGFVIFIFIIKFDSIKTVFIESTQSTFIESLNDFQKNIILEILIGVFGILFSALVSLLPTILKIPQILKHRIYLKLRNKLYNSNYSVTKYALNKNVNSFFYIDYKSIEEQTSAHDTILERIISKNNEIIWLVGKSFSGKTITVENILISLITNDIFLSNFKCYDNKIVYIDFKNTDYESFIKKYGEDKYNKYLLIIDNASSLSSLELLDLLNNLIRTIPKAKMIIVCLREHMEITQDPFIASQIYSKIKQTGEILELSPLQYNDINNEIHIPNDKLHFLNKMDEYQKIHFINMYNISDKNRHFQFIESYLVKVNKRSFEHKVIYIISILCIFKGSFLFNEFIKIFPLLDRIEAKYLLDNLFSCGFIIRSLKDFDDVYIFNESVARYYFKKGYKAFKNSRFSKETLIKQYDKYRLTNNYYAFLYNCFLNPSISVQRALFDQIAINTNFEALLNDLLYVQTITKKLNYNNYYRELGILYDRTGNIKESRHMFIALLEHALSEGNTDLAIETYYRLIQINHSDYDKFPELQHHPSNSCYINLCKKYWNLHIQMHRGNFKLADFIDLMTQSNSLCKQQPKYDDLHLLRRIYFDTYRLYFLNGSMDSIIIDIKNKGEKMATYLRNNLKEFEMYYSKFTVLFLLINDVLFNFILDETVISQQLFSTFLTNTNLDYSDMSNLPKLLDESIKICETLENDFRNVGDKTFNFIKYYRAELLIAKGSPSVLPLIQQYIDFGKEEIEYRVYADFLRLKYWLAKLTVISNIETDDENEFNEINTNIKQQIDNISLYFQNGYVNDYAQIRLKLYKLLFHILNQNQDTDELNQIMSFALSKNYNREIKLLKIISDANMSKPYIWYRNVILFYPIVPQ